MKKKSFEVPDRNLWDEVTRSIRPLGKRALKMSAASVTLPKQAIQLLPQKAAAPKISLNKGPPPITGFDRRTQQKLTRGNVEIESRLDLHGMNLEEARIRLLDFISSRRLQGHRLVLVITGKGASPFSGHTLHGRDHFTPRNGKGACAGNCPSGCMRRNFVPMFPVSSRPTPSMAAAGPSM